VKTEKPVLLRRAHFKPDNLQQVIAGMYAVVNEGGTGRAGQLPNIKVCGKTGTAQVASSQFTKGAKLREALANNVWFVGFAPQDSPEIAVVALYENGEESYNAVPIVRDVLKAYFDKKTRESQSQVAKVAPFTEPGLFAPPHAIATVTMPSPGGWRQ
jgi:penicillin-binding protein 2